MFIYGVSIEKIIFLITIDARYLSFKEKLGLNLNPIYG